MPKFAIQRREIMPGAAIISRSMSVYLDLLRCSAAIMVLLSHACKPGIADSLLPNLVLTGMDAVTVFFVLSGFVISYTAQTREHSLTDYLVARLARLWSVAVPAMLLAALLGAIGSAADPGLYARQVPPDLYGGFSALERLIQNWPALRFLFGFLFLNEAWSLTIVIFDNAPYWSLSYEFCYYLLFAACFYLRSWRRMVAGFAVVGVFGPKILLLFPVWLLGVALHRLQPRVPRWLAWPCVLAPLVVYAAATHFQLWAYAWVLDALMPFPVSWSIRFGWQFVLGCLVVVNLIGFSSLGRPEFILKLERPIRVVAARTLSIYLFHFPLLCCLAAVLPRDWDQDLRSWVILGVTAIAIELLSRITEARKKQWRSALQHLVAFGPGKARARNTI